METKTYSLIESIEFGLNFVADYYFQKNQDSLIYTNQWYLWDGNLWNQFNDNSMTLEITTFFVNELKKVVELSQPDKTKKSKSITGKTNISHILNLVKAHVLKFSRASNLLKIIDSSRDNINYKNGLLELRTGVFRPRVKTDYISNCLNYNYEIDNKKYQKEIDNINSIFRKVCNNNDELYEFKKDCLAYFLTGETKETKFFFETGVGANGKSLMIEAFSSVFNVYVKKLGNRTFSGNYGTIHKHILGTIGKRLAYIEEISTEKLNVEVLKDFVNGAEICCEILFVKETIVFDSQAKLVMICNRPPEFKTDGGIKRRGIVCEFNNRFVDDPAEVNEANGIYLEDKNLKYMFKTIEYQNALISILLPYTIKYYKTSLVVPKTFIKLFKLLCDENDTIKQFISDNFAVTNNKNDKISKDDFTKFFNAENKMSVKFINLLPDIRRLGIDYKHDAQVNGKRGVCGLRLTTDEEREHGNNDGGADHETTKIEKVESVSTDSIKTHVKIDKDETPKKRETVQKIKKVLFKPFNSRVPEKERGVEAFGYKTRKVKQSKIEEPDNAAIDDAVKDALECITEIRSKAATKNNKFSSKSTSSLEFS